MQRQRHPREGGVNGNMQVACEAREQCLFELQEGSVKLGHEGVKT